MRHLGLWGVLLVFVTPTSHADAPVRTPLAACRAYVQEFGRSVRNYLPLGGPGFFVYANLRAAFHARNLAAIGNILTGVPALHSIFEFKTLTLDRAVIHRDKIREMIHEEGFEARLGKFRDVLKRAREQVDPKGAWGGPKVGDNMTVWDAALEVNGGNTDKALDFMMLFVQDDAAAKNGIVPLLENYKGDPVAAKMWAEIDKARRDILATDQEIRFLRPGSTVFSTPDREAPPGNLHMHYHFWSAAFLAKELRKRGVDPHTARLLAMLNGDAYEKTWYLTQYFKPAKIVKKALTGEDTLDEDERLTHPLHHIAMHLRGAFFGVEPNPAKIPTQDAAFEFVKRNFWDHYSALGVGDYKLEGKTFDPTTENVMKAMRGLSPAKRATLLAVLGYAFLQEFRGCSCQAEGTSFSLGKKVGPGVRMSLGLYASSDACNDALKANGECL